MIFVLIGIWLIELINSIWLLNYGHLIVDVNIKSNLEKFIKNLIVYKYN